jgi:thiazole-adenylate synthase
VKKMIDEVDISRAIAESYMKDLLDCMSVDVAIGGAGPSGMIAAYYLAKNNYRVAIFERSLSAGGGMWGGGMMFSRIAVQEEAKPIINEFGIHLKRYRDIYMRMRWRPLPLSAPKRSDRASRSST